MYKERGSPLTDCPSPPWRSSRPRCTAESTLDEGKPRGKPFPLRAGRTPLTAVPSAGTGARAVPPSPAVLACRSRPLSQTAMNSEDGYALPVSPAPAPHERGRPRQGLTAAPSDLAPCPALVVLRVKAKPCGWPSASLDPSARREPICLYGQEGSECLPAHVETALTASPTHCYRWGMTRPLPNALQSVFNRSAVTPLQLKREAFPPRRKRTSRRKKRASIKK